VRRDLLLAIGLLVAGAVEVALGPDEGLLVRALAVPVGTLPLAYRRSRPLIALTAVAVAFIAQAALADLLEGHPVVPLLVLIVALYSAGRYAESLPLAALGALVLAGARIAFDPAVDGAPDAALTVVAALLPVLVGRWARGQDQLRRELADKAERLERERRRDAREAAEEERMRIAADLQVAATGSLETIAREARDVARRLNAGDAATARETLGAMATGARQALADVRRVLGILRREDPEPPAPPAPPAPAPGRPPPPEWLLPAALLVAAGLELQLRFGGVAAALSAVLIAAPLLVRTRLPLAAAAGVLAAVALQSLMLDPETFPVTSIVAVVCASYAIGSHSDHSVAGLVAFAAGDVLHAALVHPDALAPALLGGVLVPWTVGRIRRGQRLLTREAAERAAESERARERDARAAAGAERMRVARELHDAVAHNISVVAIQAAGAQGVVDRDPARAAEVVALIEEVVAEALAELGRLADDGEPQPSLAGVDALAQRARDGGLPVELHVEGDPAPLPAGVDLAAFRIVQEALANTSKHAGDARARVVVRYRPRAVELEIDDDGRGANGTAGTGHGLIGMRERVALYRGTLEVGRRGGGGFAVRARLPLGDA
jgi:signal transduction histidine kinase